MDFRSGTSSSFDDNGNQIILDLKDGLDFLNPTSDGIAFLKRIGTNGFTYANQKHEWTETELATRREAVTINDSSTTLTVNRARQYQVNNLLRVGNEVMRVTAIASDTTLTVVRGYADTDAASHTAATLFSLGSADPEGSDAPAGVQNFGQRLFNFNQTLTRAVSLTTDQIAQLNTEGNPMTGQIRRRFIELNRELFQAIMYGRKYEDETNEIYAMGGMDEFVTTNVDNVNDDVSVSAIDAIIKAIVDEGGDPKVIVVGTKQKQKLDAIDANLVRIGKREPNVGGNPKNHTWQSGILDHDIDIMVDHTILDDQLWIFDTDYVEVGHKSHNGVQGAFHVVDATPPGADRRHQTIRGKYSLRLRQQKAHGYLYGLS